MLRWLSPPLRISRETTFITSPLLPSGRPDYVGYLNQKYSEGVTPENNAAVKLVQLTGSSLVDPVQRAEYFRQLGIPDPGQQALWIEWERYATENGIHPDRLQEIETLLITAPESLDPSTSPDVASWIAANQLVLDRLHEAAALERFFNPFDSDSSPVVAGDDLIIRVREPVRLLRLRGQLELSAGDLDSALRDDLALLRIGSLLQTQPVYLGWAVGGAFERQGISEISGILGSNRLTTGQGEFLRREVSRLPPAARTSQVVNEQLRFGYLNLAMSLTSKNAVIARFPGDFRKPRLAWGTDINQLLVRINRDHDKFATICDLEDLRERQKNKDAWSDLVKKEDSPRRIMPQWSIDLYRKLGWTPPLVVTEAGNREIFAPRFEFSIWQDALEVRRRLLNAAMRISEFRSRTGNLPASLDDMGTIQHQEFTDPWSNNDHFRYRVRDDGFMLWSVGPNGEDNRGWELSERGWELNDEVDSDDIRFGLNPQSLASRPNSAIQPAAAE